MNLIYRKGFQISNGINILIPTVGEVIDQEDSYYELVQLLTAMPIDFMVQLDDIGVDFTTITDYDLFLMLFPGISGKDTRLIFGDLDLSRFERCINQETGMEVMYDMEDDILIDRLVQTQIANTLRKIHHLEKNIKKPGNEDAREYLLRRAREKAKRKRKRGGEESQLEQLITAMVNTEQFKYDYEGTKDLSIYQFNESVRQIMKKVDYDNRMYGIYAGTVDPKKLSQDELNWLTHK